jgi:hypothetical protein
MEVEPMKRVSRAAAIAVVLAAMPVAFALASNGPSGTYTTTVKSSQLAGTYKITFTPGHFTVQAPYGIKGNGTDSVSGSRITLHGPGSCTSAGTYEFKISRTTLTFRKIKDPCERSIILAYPMKKV